jgi:hypothetical protein
LCGVDRIWSAHLRVRRYLRCGQSDSDANTFAGHSNANTYDVLSFFLFCL